jgi:uncharacterized membrane-anchored protein
VSDADAAEIDYADLLKDMQQATRDENPERVKAGYPAMELVGWAEPPHYDAADKKLYWAKTLQITRDGEPAPTRSVNYDIRVLGREGYLLLSGIAAEEQLGTVKPAMQALLPSVSFKEGHRYADYVEKTDRAAGYGIAALVAGGVLAKKAGLFAGLGLLLLKMKKLLILLVVGGSALAKKVLGRGKGEGAPPAP